MVSVMVRGDVEPRLPNRVSGGCRREKASFQDFNDNNIHLSVHDNACLHVATEFEIYLHVEIVG